MHTSETADTIGDARRLLSGGSLAVLGGPGTGKTRALAETFGHLVAGGADPDDILVLAPSRGRADGLRDRLSASLGTVRSGPLARTPQSLAFGLLSARAAARGEQLRFISGAEQDAILADLLAGHERGEGRIPPWPARITPEIRSTAAFRSQLRDVLGRAMEWGLDPEDLTRAAPRGREAWRACATVLREYTDLTLFADVAAMDPAGILAEATALLRESAASHPESTRPGHALWFTTWRVPRVVLVDDAQDVTEAVGRLLDALADLGAVIAVYASPDSVTEGFRGVRAEVAMAAAGIGPGDGGQPRFARGGHPHHTYVITRNHRAAPELASLVREWSRSITRATRMHEEATPGSGRGAPAAEKSNSPDRDAMRPGPVGVSGAEGEAPRAAEAVLARSAGAEAAHVARHIRESHLGAAGVPYERIAVIGRSMGALAEIERELEAQGVPLHSSATETALRDHPATVPLLAVLGAGGGQPEPALAEELLLSAYGGLDRLGLLRLRRQLGVILDAEMPAAGLPVAALPVAAPGESADPNTSSVAAQQRSPADGAATKRPDPLSWALRAETSPSLREQSLARALDRIRAMLAARDSEAEPHAALWKVWRAAGVATAWQDRVLEGGPDAPRADSDLDAVMRLFALAEKFTADTPGGGPEIFVDHVRAQAVAQDSLAARPRREAVTVTTAASAAGREWDLVIVPGLQAGRWPNVTIRGSLLGADDLPSVAEGRPVPGGSPQAVARERREVFRDEASLVLAAFSRAKSRVLFTAVQSRDTRPGVFFDSLASMIARPVNSVTAPAAEPAASEQPMPLTLRGLAGRARRDLETAVLEGDEAATGPRAALLAMLARAGVAGADPGEWSGVAAVSSGAPIRDESEMVSVSPSSVEQFETCPLRWFLERHGGSPSVGAAQSMGTMVHAIAERHPRGTREELRAAFEGGFAALEFDTEWQREAQRERGLDMVEKLAGYQILHAREYRGGEVAIDVEIPDAQPRPFRVRGTMDRVDARDGGLRVIDFKTGGAAVSKAEAEESAQLLSYQLAIASGTAHWDGDSLEAIGTPEPGAVPGAESVGAELVYLGTSTAGATIREQAPLGDRLPEARRRLSLVAQGMSRADFPATPNSGCGHCPVREACPALSDRGAS